MRNENLDLAAHSSGSESSPSWASTNATPRASATTTFTFDFTGSGGGGQSARTVDELTHQFKKTLRSSRSSEALSETCENTSTTTASSSSSSSTRHLIPSGSSSSSSHHSKKKSYKFGGSGEHFHGDSVSGDGGGGGGGMVGGSGSSSCGSSSGGGGVFGGDDKKATKESKIARFLRRTQSAHDDHYGGVGPPKSSGEVSRETPLEKIEDTDEEAQTRKRIKIGTDMKFRLGFLKRRHTEGTIQASSVRPQPEEAQKWANSFSDLMASKYGQALFKAFLQREFSEENIEFWLAVEDYRKSRQNKLNSKAQKIFNEFVTPQAPKEVNLDALTREGLVSKMAQPTHTTFDQAQKRVQGLLEADAYSRFLKSELYMELLHPEKYSSQQNS